MSKFLAVEFFREKNKWYYAAGPDADVEKGPFATKLKAKAHFRLNKEALTALASASGPPKSKPGTIRPAAPKPKAGCSFVDTSLGVYVPAGGRLPRMATPGPKDAGRLPEGHAARHALALKGTPLQQYDQLQALKRIYGVSLPGGRRLDHQNRTLGEVDQDAFGLTAYEARRVEGEVHLGDHKVRLKDDSLDCYVVVGTVTE